MTDRILLVNPHDTAQSGFTNPPLGLLYLAGTLRAGGLDVRVVDGCREGKGAVEAALREYQPRLVGVTCLTPGRHQAREVARLAKALSPGCTTVLGGVHPTIMWRQILDHYPEVDLCVLGEGEQTLLELCQGRPLAEVQGIAYRRDGQAVKTRQRPLCQDLDGIPFPAWDLVDLRRYPTIGDKVFRGIDLAREPRVSVIFSRGCTGHCDFCSTWWVWRGYRHRSARNMVDELELLHRRHGIRHFCFADDALTVDREATLALCDEILARGLRIAFHATTRSDCVDEEVLTRLAAAGCYDIAFGIETGSPALLQAMNKENDVAAGERAMKLARQAGIRTTALIIVGNVGETTDSIADTIRFLNRAQPDIVGSAGALWIFPGTQLYQHCKRQGFIDDSFWLGEEPYKIYDREWPREALQAFEQMVYHYRDYREEEPVLPATPPPAALPAAAPRPAAAAGGPRIVCQMRIKNEGRWIREVLDSIARVAPEIVVLDDGSTDDTPAICRAHPAVVEYVHQQEPRLDEVRDKNRLLKMALARNPDWILCMDGDEVLEDSAPERIRAAIAASPPGCAVLDVEFLYMWNDRRHYRTDGIYRRIFHHRLFQVTGQDREKLSFAPTAHGGNFHCESVPPNIRGSSREIDVKVKHLGYMLAEDRRRKHQWYSGHDPAHAAQGYYDHLLDQPGMTLEEWRERPFEPAADPGAGKQERKGAAYYANVRRNAIDRVPAGARRILDVGCGQGLTGGALRAERGAEVVGIEYHPEVAAAARQHLDQVLVGDVEGMDLPFPEGHFDCILLLDVLEHLVDPWKALSRLVRCLHPQGTVVASLPNVRNLAVLRQILDGSFAYQEQGILDRTHLRFFARADMLALFRQAGLEAEVVEVVRDPVFEGKVPRAGDAPIDLTLGNLALHGLSPSDVDELTAIQLLFTARHRGAAARAALPPPRPAPARPQAVMPERPLAPAPGPEPLVSIVIPVHGKLEYTRGCLESIRAHPEGLELEVVVVDDASPDGTAAWLRQQPDVRAVFNPRNLGFARSCNAGARAARGRYLLFLNNDTLVQPGWVGGMLEALRTFPGAGLVGNLQVFPGTGLVQHAGIVCGPKQTLYSLYNGQLPADHPAVQRTREMQFVAGSCMLLERAFFEELGGFDEGYLNSCEDVDLCMSVRAAGRAVVYAPRSRIFHFESRTVSGHAKDGGNYRRFLERWGEELVQDDHLFRLADGQLAPRAMAPEPAAPAVARPRAPRVALVAPPRNFKSPQISSYSGYSKNLGIGYLAAALRAAGAEVSVLDAFALGVDRFEREESPEGTVYRCGLPFEEIARWVPEGCDLIGISVPFSNVASIAFDLAAVLKARHPRARIVLGGVHPSTFPAESLRPGVDLVVAGEGEEAIVALARGVPPEQVPGCSWRDAAGAVHLASRPALLADLDAVPFPAWDLLPMERYLARSPRGDRVHRALSLITSRGCPFACTFCSIHPVAGRKWRARSPANVLAEVRAARERYGIDHLEIEDDNFTLDRDRALAILRGLREIDPRLTWAAHNGVRIDTLDEELLREIRDSGCTQLNLAVEHGSPSVLARMEKKLSLEKVREVVAACGRLGIPTVGFCLVGHPGETAQAFGESFRFFQELRRCGLGHVAPFIVNAYPGTRLHREAAASGWLAPGAERQRFFLEDEFVSIVTPDFDAETVRARKRAMEILEANPAIDAAQVLSRLPSPPGAGCAA